jgi:hypothetical protein
MAGRGKGNKGLGARRPKISAADAIEILETVIPKKYKDSIPDIARRVRVEEVIQEIFDGDRNGAREELNQVLESYQRQAFKAFRNLKIARPAYDKAVLQKQTADRKKIQDSRKAEHLRQLLARREIHEHLDRMPTGPEDQLARGVLGLKKDLLIDLTQYLSAPKRPIFKPTPALIRQMKSARTNMI